MALVLARAARLPLRLWRQEVRKARHAHSVAYAVHGGACAIRERAIGAPLEVKHHGAARPEPALRSDAPPCCGAIPSAYHRVWPQIY